MQTHNYDTLRRVGAQGCTWDFALIQKSVLRLTSEEKVEIT